MPKLVGELPPSGHARPKRWREVEEARRLALANPGSWVLALDDTSLNVAARIRAGMYGYTKDEWQCVTRNNTPQGKADVYVRYIGGQTDDPR